MSILVTASHCVSYSLYFLIFFENLVYVHCFRPKYKICLASVNAAPSADGIHDCFAYSCATMTLLKYAYHFNCIYLFVDIKICNSISANFWLTLLKIYTSFNPMALEHLYSIFLTDLYAMDNKETELDIFNIFKMSFHTLERKIVI